jgi:hypothetical protein
MAKPIEKDITPSKLTPEQIAKQAQLEASYAAMQNQVTRYEKGTEYRRLAEEYAKEAKDAVVAGRAIKEPPQPYLSTSMAAGDAYAAAGDALVLDAQALQAQQIQEPVNPAPAVDPNAGKTSIGVAQDEKGNWFTLYTDGTKSPLNATTTTSTPTAPTTKVSPATPTPTPTPTAPTAPTVAVPTAADMARMDAIEAMKSRFKQYGLESLVAKIKELAVSGASETTITLQLQETPEYKTRFAANESRIKKNLQVLSPGEYLTMEDTYRQTLRAYGLTQFDNDAYVKQFIANDVSPTELSNRVVTAVQRVRNADPAIATQLREYYGIGQEDLVAYVLDPEQQFQKIQRQVAASEIGVAAGRQGLKAGVGVAEQLAAQGVTQAEAQKGYSTIADILPTSQKLSDIYGTTMDTYGQSEAEQEVFNSLASAQRKRQALTARELAQFSGTSGTGKASLASQARGQI